MEASQTHDQTLMSAYEALRDLPPRRLDKTPAQVAKAGYHYKSWLDVAMGGWFPMGVMTYRVRKVWEISQTVGCRLAINDRK